MYEKSPYYDGYQGITWPEEAKQELSDLAIDIPSMAELVSRIASNAEKIIHECLSELSG
ncbi:MAG: hypothetical protein KAJ55_17090 [Anaerolineales bacterium]|jgi:hypothetical protein|nr:hypothetical protein [Anaerolineales bacterium]